MKALKEKRISLRSLWRMGLVILSVFALMFASCGNSDPGETPSENPPPAQAKVPISISITKYPDASRIVYEGQRVSLLGLEMIALYADGTVPVSGTDDRVTIEPMIYDYRTVATATELGSPLDAASNYNRWDMDNVKIRDENGNPAYKITFKDGGVTKSVYVPGERLGVHKRLIDIAYGKNMTKQDYYIDDIPNFAGLYIEGIYNDANEHDPFNATDYQRELPNFTTDVPDYQWRWVHNIDRFTPGSPPGTGDNPGVLLKIGSLGNLRSDPDNPIDPVVGLQGPRINVSNLYQVEKVEFATKPDYKKAAIFFDDPSLIGVNAKEDRWLDDVFAGVELKVTYEGENHVKTKSLREWKMLKENENLWNQGLELSFVIDATEGDVFDIVSGTGAQWDEWATMGAPSVQFEYRGVGLDAAEVLPIYTALSGIVVKSRDPKVTVPVMNGSDKVYQKQQLRDSFFAKIIVQATYTTKSKLAAGTYAAGVREDVSADIAKEICQWWNDDTDEYTLYSDDLADALNLENSQAYFANRAKTQTVTVYFTATDNEGTDSEKSQKIQIGVLNYTNTLPLF